MAGPHSPAFGFLSANVRERARALGTSDLDDHLGLSEEERFNAQGNAMDPEAVNVGLATLLTAWSRDPTTVQRHTSLRPHRLWRVQLQLRAAILQAFGPEGDGTLDEHSLHVPTLAFVDPATGRVEDLLTIDSGPGGREDE